MRERDWVLVSLKIMINIDYWAPVRLYQERIEKEKEEKRKEKERKKEEEKKIILFKKELQNLLVRYDLYMYYIECCDSRLEISSTPIKQSDWYKNNYSRFNF